MLGFVIKKVDVNKDLFEAKSGSQHTYTNNILDAKIYHTIADAERSKCSNEVIIKLSSLFGY
jgi:hypothetical protein